MKAKLEKSRYIIYLIIISTLIIIPFIHIGQMAVHSDWSFHAARVQQLYLNLQKGHLFTYIGTDTFSKVGNANFIFYPTLFLYPWVILKFFFSPILSYQIYVWLLFVITSLIAYFSMQKYNGHNSLQSFYFALIYLVVPYHLYLTLTNYVLGEAIAYMFIPIVFLGMYEWLFKHKFITLAVGMSLMAYSHYVSLFISIEICVIILIAYLIQYHGISKEQIIGLGKAVILFLLLSIGQLIPLYTDLLKGNLTIPSHQFGLMQNAGDFIVSAFNNNALNQGGIGVLLVITLLIGWKFISRDSISMWIYVIAAMITLAITTAFPWQYFRNTPLSIIQFPYRYTSFAGFFLSIILAEGLSKLRFRKLKSPAITGLVTLGIVVLCAGSLWPDYQRNKGEVANTPILHSARHGQYRTLRSATDTPLIINNQTYNDQFSYGALYGETDYMPKPAFYYSSSVLNRQILVNGKVLKNHVNPQSSPNSLKYTVKAQKGDKLDLPVLAYRNTQVSVNGRVVNFTHSQRGTVQLTASKHSNNISVSYKPRFLFNLSRIVSLITLIMLLLIYVSSDFTLKFKK